MYKGWFNLKGWWLSFFHFLDVSELLLWCLELFFFFTFHQLLLSYLGLLACLLTHALYILMTFFCMIFPYDLEHFIRVVRSNGRPDGFASESDLNELFFVFPFRVKGEPVIKILSANTPTMWDSLCIDKCGRLHVWEEDSFGGCEGEIVLVDDEQLFVDGDLFILVKNLCHIQIII